MKKPKTDQLLKGVIGTSFALTSLTACSTASNDPLFSVPVEEAPTNSAAPEELPPSPEEADCDTWKWDEEAEGYQCAEEGSEHHGHYYYGGSWFPTIAAFMAGRAMGGKTGSGTVNREKKNVTQPNPNTGNKDTTTTNPSKNPSTSPGSNPRSGMGGGGSFGG
ncbi:hypothetical protein [Halalkalibacter urbisdiaboli]|uniref:hypothetical protein n=1 Tax=Halalkalibacter urbisdiaboli TaxID=1960589 RepID=UPI0013FD24DF|nr:hypothetical protein [Halalkalibacter urbisdiaboli]